MHRYGCVHVLGYVRNVYSEHTFKAVYIISRWFYLVGYLHQLIIGEGVGELIPSQSSEHSPGGIAYRKAGITRHKRIADIKNAGTASSKAPAEITQVGAAAVQDVCLMGCDDEKDQIRIVNLERGPTTIPAPVCSGDAKNASTLS